MGFRSGLALAAILACLSQSAGAQTYPDHPIRLIVPTGPGGASDVVSRIVAEKVQASLRQPVVVETRPGANGIVGAAYVLSQPADGYTLMMGHIGLTPQFVHALGGYKVQGKTLAEAERLKREAVQLQDAGCFAIVLECVPAELAAQISRGLPIPTIGIGAGAQTDGQVLVLQDLLGLNKDFKPKLVKHFMRGADMNAMAVNLFVKEVKTGVFPNAEHHFHAEGMAGDQEKNKRKLGLCTDDGGAA